jgi:hypothetical protein
MKRDTQTQNRDTHPQAHDFNAEKFTICENGDPGRIPIWLGFLFKAVNKGERPMGGVAQIPLWGVLLIQHDSLRACGLFAA